MDQPVPSSAVFLRDLLARARVLPTVTLRAEADALWLGEVLTEAGYPAVEILLRDPNTWDCVTKLRSQCPDLAIGLGTLKNANDLKRAQSLGLDFGVSPGFCPDLYEAAQELSWPYLPGFSSASELMAIEAKGALCAKFFPAQALGSSYLAQLMAAFGGLSIVPSGGLKAAHLKDFFLIPQVVCLSGSWMMGPEGATKAQIIQNLLLLKKEALPSPL